MRIKRTSPVSGIEHEMDMSITTQEFDRLANGELIQNVCPHLTTEEREFFISGVYNDEWDEFLPPEED